MGELIFSSFFYWIKYFLIGDILKNNLINYIRDDKFSLYLIDNCLNIVNFDNILVLEEEKIAIIVQNKVIVIRGRSLSINKLLDKEILIMGIFKSIELGE